MLSKPSHLRGEYGTWFRDPGIIAAYHYRPPYPDEVFDTFVALIQDAPRVVLDVGCGTGDIARRLAPRIDRVDAVDFSPGMIAKGKHLPGGDHPHLTWIHGAVEDVSLSSRYALITAGESLHWMAWEAVLARFADLLTPRGVLAIVERDWDDPPVLRERLRPIFQQYSPVRDYQAVNWLEQIASAGLFRALGEKRTRLVPWQPTLDEYVECRHSQRGFSRDRMAAADVAAFDAAVRRVLTGMCQDGMLTMRDGRLQLAVNARIIWGEPRPPVR